MLRIPLDVADVYPSNLNHFQQLSTLLETVTAVAPRADGTSSVAVERLTQFGGAPAAVPEESNATCANIFRNAIVVDLF
jgi:hypothetical protein